MHHTLNNIILSVLNNQERPNKINFSRRNFSREREMFFNVS